MRVRVSGMVWIRRSDLKAGLIERLRRELTVIPKVVGNYGKRETPAPIECFAENAVEFGVPREWWFKTAQETHDYQWDLSYGSPVILDGSLRHDGTHSEQRECIDRFVQRVKTDGSVAGRPCLGGILQAAPGFGKTNTALGIVRELGMTTLVLVHKEFLMSQWRDRILKFFPEAKVGLVQGKKCQFDGKDIVIAMQQSMSRTVDDVDRYPGELFDWPGLLIVDECHRSSAPTFSPIPSMFRSAYRLGLTATPRRKDGADDVFWWNLGDIFYSAKKVMPVPSVRITEIQRQRDMPAVVKRPDVSSAIVINVMVRLKGRNHLVVKETLKAVRAASGRKVIVLSERLDHLRDLSVTIGDALKSLGLSVSMSFYVGEWFVGEQSQVLRRDKWSMEGDGRANAIKLVYQSLSRRKEDFGCSIQGLSHQVVIPGTSVNSILGLFGSYAHDDDELVPVTLENLTDVELFAFAREFGVAQRSKEKLKTLSEDELREAERAQIIFATVQMLSEGIDIPAADTLVMATPISDVEQAVGRIRRECLPEPGKCEHYCAWRAGTCKGKPIPIVCDFVDIGIPLSSKRYRWRREWYDAEGFRTARSG
jgi:hypothetical protein